MSTTGQQDEFMTLLDWIKHLNPDGTEAQIIELMTEQNDLYKTLMFREANNGVGHETTVETSLPEAFLSAYGMRHKASKGTVVKITEPTAMAKTFAKIEYDMAKLNGNNRELFRKGKRHAEALAQLVTGQFFYGNHTNNALHCNGLTLRRSSLSGENAKVVVDAGGTAGGGLTSIWLCGMGEGGVYGIYPKGSNGAGVETVDSNGPVWDTNDDGELLVYKSRWMQFFGLAEEDHRKTIRIANLSTVNMALGTQEIVDHMDDAYARIRPNKDGVTHYWMMTNTVFRNFMKQVKSRVGQSKGYDWETIDRGYLQREGMATYMGIPILFNDQQLHTESAVA